MQRLKRLSWLLAFSGASGCQLVSGLNELEVVPSPDGEDTQGERTTEGAVTGETGDASAPDDCAVPTGLECAPSDNCGCDKDEVCGLATDGDELTVACQPAGKRDVGDGCNLGDCARGSLCVDHVCQQVCRFNKDCELDEATCTEVPLPTGGTIKGVRYCHANCDPVSPTNPSTGLTACAAEQTCALTAQGTVCSSNVGDGDQGDICDEASDCAAGFTCDVGQCKRWCTLADSGCDDGLTCEPARTDGPATEGLGVCSGGCEATVPEGDECLTNPNCGCSHGETCRVMGDGSRACSPAGDAPAQSQCENNGHCGDGLACMAGLCRPYCDPSAPECSDESLCVEVQYDGQSVGVGACLGLCDPVRPNTDDAVFTPCGQGAECIAGDLEYYYGTSHCMPAPEVPGPMLGACDEDNPCAAGSACLIGRCFPFCRAPEDCTGATEYAVCFDTDLGFRGSEGDVLGVCCPATPVPGSSCAFDLDCGCDDGFSCRIGDTATGATECTSVGEKGYQETCEYDADCIAGHSCVGGLCSPHCVGTDSCAANEGACIQVYSGGEAPEPVPYAYVCAGRCDPVDVTRADDEVKPCGVGADCTAGWADATEGFSVASYCAPDLGSAAVGDPCASDEECALGLACDFIDCTEDECTGSCVAYCENDDDCDPSAACDLTVGRIGAPGTEIGYCRSLSAAPDGDAG